MPEHFLPRLGVLARALPTTRPGDVAVFYRTNSQSRVFEECAPQGKVLADQIKF